MDTPGGGRYLFDNSPIALLVEDSSELKKYFDRLRADGVEDFEEYALENPDAAQYAAGLVKIVDVNKRALILFQAESKEDFQKNIANLFNEESLRGFQEALIRLFRGELKFAVESQHKMFSGEVLDVQMDVFIPEEHAETFERAYVSMQDITDQRLAAEKQLMNLQTLEAVLESAADGILVVDGSGKLLHCNSRFAWMWGIPESLIHGKNDERLKDYVLEQVKDHGMYMEKVRDLRGSESESFDRIEFRDGRIFDRYSRPLIIGGEVAGRVWSFRDVTGQVMAEKALIDSQFEVELKNRISNAFLTVDDDRMYSEVLNIVTQALECRLGYFGYMNGDGDLVCPTMEGDIFPDCQIEGKVPVFPVEAWGGLWGKSLRDATTEISNSGLNVPSGHRPLENALCVPIIHGGKLIGLFTLANRDGGFGENEVALMESLAREVAPVLGARLAWGREEAERKRAEEESRISRMRLEALWEVAKNTEIEFSEVPNIMMDGIARITQSKLGFFGQMSQNKGTVIATTWTKDTAEDFSVKNTSLELDVASSGLWGEAIRNGETLIVNEYVREHPAKKALPDGHVPLKRLMVVPIFLDDEMVSVVAVANKKTDYTEDDARQVEAFVKSVQILMEKKLMEEEHRKVQEQLMHSQKMEAVGQLAGGVAHDFNNMLGVILGYSQMMLSDMAADDPNREGMESIIEAATRSRDLTMKLLTFARKERLHVEQVRMKAIIGDLAGVLTSSLRKKVSVSMDVGPGILVEADRNQIYHALLNICNNAADAMPSGGEIEISCCEREVSGIRCTICREEIRGRFCQITIKDTGSGIDEQILAKIFEPFFTTKGVGAGTGLGLSVTLGIIRAHGGHISVVSQSGRGTQFRVFLPLSAGMPRAFAASPSINKFEIVRGAGTVLIIDDEDHMLRILDKTLLKAGYTTISEKSGARAVDVFRKRAEEIDLVILDMLMPGMDGTQVFNELKIINPDVKVVISSGYSAEGAANALLENGAKAYIQKPFTPEELTMVVGEIISGDFSPADV